MAQYSVTYTEGDVLKTIYFDHEMALTILLADIAERGALILPKGSLDGTEALQGRKAVMKGNIISVQDDPV